MSGEPLAHPAGRIGVLDRTDREAIVAHHPPPTPASDVALGAAGLLVDDRKPLQETIEGLLATVERVDLVRGVELLDGGELVVVRRHSSTLFSARSRARRGFLMTGRSRTSRKACHCASSSQNRRRSIGLLGGIDARFEQELLLGRTIPVVRVVGCQRCTGRTGRLAAEPSGRHPCS
jgi:hypothetical protein